MRSKAFACAAAFALALSAAHAAQRITGTTDKDSYRAGETIVFTFAIAKDGTNAAPAAYQWERRGDDGAVETGSGSAAPGAKFTLETKLGKPGFAGIAVHLLGADGKRLNRRDSRWAASAAVEPENMRPVPEPEDFDEFWKRQAARLAAAPWKDGMKREIHPSSDAKFGVFRLSIPAPGPRPATAHMLMPASASPSAKKPLHIRFQGYGWAGAEPPPASWFNGSEIIIDVNAHGYELGRGKACLDAFKADVSKDGGYGFSEKENADPETTYYNGMILRGLRVLEFAKTLPEWDGKTLKVSGGSQGGFQAILMAALDHDVTFMDSAVAWLCDMGGKAKLGRCGGWQPAYTEALNYYDPVHHARRIPRTCRAYISRNGLGDSTCPPSGVWMVYNNIAAPKKMRVVQGSEHGDWGAPPEGSHIFHLSEGFDKQ